MSGSSMKIEFKNMKSASKRIVANGSLRVTHVYKRLCFLGPYGRDPFASSLEFAADDEPCMFLSI
jgi:hypothetical protein